MRSEIRAGKIRALVVDDHALVAEGIALALGRHDDIEIVGTEGSVAGAVAAALQLRPDVVLMDYHLADGTGVNAATGIREHLPNTVIVMISGDMSEAHMLAAVEAGASGYVLKTESSDRLAAHIRRAAVGEMLIPAGMLQRLMTLSRTQRTSDANRPISTAGLTPRELEVLRLMARGMDNPEIAEHLVVSVHTVRSHVESIREKLGARSKLEAVAKANAQGLI